MRLTRCGTKSSKVSVAHAAKPIEVVRVAFANSNGERWFNLTAEEKQSAFGDKADEYLDFVQ